MPRAFATIAFTPSVKAAQSRYGSRDANLGFERAEDSGRELTLRETEFIQARDSFYQATVSQSGWPYVQHRGGPPGFLKVLDSRTLGFADFRGNVQYLSVGNLTVNDRIALILMDYPNRRRLKIWGRASIVHESEDAALIARLESPTYRARIERAIVIHVEAWDWNCPQHITPRYTEAEIEATRPPVTEPQRTLETQPSSAAIASERVRILGHGPLELVITGVRQLTPRVRAFELRRPDGAELPRVDPGAHLRVPVVLPNGEHATRHYSISSDPRQSTSYEIAVLLDATGAGGSRFVHDDFGLGKRLRCDEPQNHFRLKDDAGSFVMIAGGIGITPIKSMVSALKAMGKQFRLHYAARSAVEMAYRDELTRECGESMTLYPGDRAQRMDLGKILSGAPHDATFYVCGPARLIDELVAAASTRGIDPARIRLERFSAASAAENRAVTLELRRSGEIVEVAAGKNLLAAVRSAGVDALSDCEVGTCGTCAVKVLAGIVEHRDSVLTPAERTRAGLMCLCVSRARSERLTLDL